MTAIKKILIDLDPTKEKQPALERGIYLAKKYEASLTLFLVVYNRGLVASLFFDSEQLEAAKTGFVNSQKAWLESYYSAARDQGVDCDMKIVWAKPVYEAINKQANDGNYDLVIKSTHKHPTMEKILFTPNDWQLLKTSKVPIILTKSGANPVYANIMAAIDPSNRHDHSEQLDPKILRVTREIAGGVDAKAHAAHCYDPIAYQLWTDIGVGMGTGMGPADFTMGQDNYDRYIDQLKEDNEKTFNDAISAVNFPKDNLHLEEGYPEQILPNLVEGNDIDLLVMGTSYHSGLIGSTIEKILDDVSCDVMAVQV
jgi:universal stress protein E